VFVVRARLTELLVGTSAVETGPILTEKETTPMIASSYPILNIFWTMLMFFGFVIWIYLLIFVFMDIFRSHDMGGLAKAIWVIFIIVLPLLGVLIYLIARGHGMAERSAKQAQAQQQEFDAYVKKTAGTSQADQLATLAKLHDDGTLSDEDFAKAKAKVVG
jgi:Phospholipase_D-nuclease N-terminal/Short C-terminal domain